MVSAFYPPESFGGDAIFLQRLNRELLRRGHHVDVIHCADSFNALKGRRSTAFPRLDGVTVHRLKSVLGPLAPLAAHQTGRPLFRSGSIREILLSKPFDVVHFHNISVFGPKVLELPAPGDAIKLYTAHEHWLVCPLSVLWKNGRELCREPTCFGCTLRAGRPPQLWRGTRLLERACRSVDAFVAMTEASAQAHAERGFRPPMHVLNGFADESGPNPAPSPHKRPYFLFVGRLEKYKGLQDVIPLLVGEGKFDLLIAGTGGYEETLRRQARNSPRVRFIGWKDSDALGPYYGNTLGLIAPSLTHETFGLVVIEAMAHGAPVIARNLGAYAELVGHSGGGLLFSSAEGLRVAMGRLAADASERQRLGSNGKTAFRSHWTPQRHVDRYLSLIESLRASRKL